MPNFLRSPRFYKRWVIHKEIQDGTINHITVRKFLEFHGKELEKNGAEYYIYMREEFNKFGRSLDFLFLNRACFNGMIRFNKNGKFNVPFCQKPNRFSKSYITKICNQIKTISEIIKDKDWVFKCCSWEEAFLNINENDYIYLDPPYIGRDTSYIGEWSNDQAVALADYSHKTSANVCLSMWKENKFRKNTHLYDCWNDFAWHEYKHFYHIGAKEKNRHPMIEVLAIKR